jgi:hypothetical protein
MVLEQKMIDEDRTLMAEFSKVTNGARMVPQILIDDKHIGGFSDLTELHMEIKPIADKKLTAYHDWHGYESNMGKHIGKMFGEIESLEHNNLGLNQLHTVKQQYFHAYPKFHRIFRVYAQAHCRP